MNYSRIVFLSSIVGLHFTPVFASPWETWQVEGHIVAGYCSPEADESCIEVQCSADGAKLSLISLGAWSVTMGDEDHVTLLVDGKAVTRMAGTIEEAQGFGPEFFALKGAIEPAVLSALAEGGSAAFRYEDGYVLEGFSLNGSQDALSAAGCGQE